MFNLVGLESNLHDKADFGSTLLNKLRKHIGTLQMVLTPIAKMEFKLEPNVLLISTLNGAESEVLQNYLSNECDCEEFASHHYFIVRYLEDSIQISPLNNQEFHILKKLETRSSFENLESQFGFNQIESLLPQLICSQYCRYV